MASVKVRTLVKVDGRVVWDVTRRHEALSPGDMATQFDVNAITTSTNLVTTVGGLDTISSFSFRAAEQTMDIGFYGDSNSSTDRIQLYPSGHIINSATSSTSAFNYKSATAGGRAQGHIVGQGNFS